MKNMINKVLLLSFFVSIFILYNCSSQDNALIKYIKKGDIAKVRNIIEREDFKLSDLKYKNKNGETALLASIKEEQEDIFNYLLDHGALIVAREKDNDGRTPLMWASLRCQYEMVRTLVLDYKVEVDDEDDNEEAALDYALSAKCPYGHYHDLIFFIVVHSNSETINQARRRATDSGEKAIDQALEKTKMIQDFKRQGIF